MACTDCILVVELSQVTDCCVMPIYPMFLYILVAVMSFMLIWIRAWYGLENIQRHICLIQKIQLSIL